MATITAKERDELVELSNPWRLDAIREVIAKLLEHRLGKVPMTLLNRIWKLSEKELQEMAVAVMDFKQIRDANAWIAAQKK
jgi:hypothetical protein